MAEVTVYNKKTGEMVRVSGPDAREYVASGGWQTEPLEGKTPTVPVPTGMIGKADGTAFASDAAATTAMTKQGLNMTHAVTVVDGGYAIAPTQAPPTYTTQGEEIPR